MTLKDQEFESLVHAYSADIYRFAYWLCNNQSLAEDMTQETFARAWKSIDKLQDERAAKAWLLTILRREMARHFSRKQLDTIPAQDIQNGLTDTRTSLPADEQIAIHEAIGKLDVKYREPLLLQVLGGYSSQEIGDILDISSTVVLTRVFRARQQLRASLNPDIDMHNVVRL